MLFFIKNMFLCLCVIYVIFVDKVRNADFCRNPLENFYTNTEKTNSTKITNISLLLLLLFTKNNISCFLSLWFFSLHRPLSNLNTNSSWKCVYLSLRRPKTKTNETRSWQTRVCSAHAHHFLEPLLAADFACPSALGHLKCSIFDWETACYYTFYYLFIIELSVRRDCVWHRAQMVSETTTDASSECDIG